MYKIKVSLMKLILFEIKLPRAVPSRCVVILSKVGFRSGNRVTWVLFQREPSSSAERHDMAQKIQTILEDDIQGGEASQTVTFSYQGKDYEIDLNDKNADKMEKAFAFYIEHARRIGGRSAARRSSRKPRPARC